MATTSKGVLEVGQTWGHYRIERLLGRGGMGEVYEVVHTTLGSRYALKLMQSEIMQVPGALERFQREAAAMHNLRHPNILHVDDFGDTNGRYWLRMELAKGCTLPDGAQVVTLLEVLNHYARQGQHAPEPLVRGWLVQILEGLAVAHEKGTVHRDIKPANMLFDGPTLKITDFGLVHLVGADWLQSQFQKSLTMQAYLQNTAQAPTLQAGADAAANLDKASSGAAAIMGTFEYMSPESKAGQVEADPRGDLYAVGKIAFQLLTCERDIGMERASDMVPGLNPDWDTWLARALKGKPDQRFQTAREMLKALPDGEAAATDWRDAPTLQGPLPTVEARPSQTAKPATTPTTATPKKANPLVPMLIALVVVLGLGGGTLYWWAQQEKLAPTPIVEEATPKLESVEADTKPESVIVAPGAPVAAPVFDLTITPAEADARFWLAEHTNKPIPGGWIELTDLPPGEHELIVQAPGYQAFSTVVNVGRDHSGYADVHLVPLKGELRVQADPVTLVTAIDAQGKEIQLGTTDAKGVLVVANLLNIGTYDLRLSKALHHDELQHGVTLRIGKATDVQADLVPLPGKLNVFSVPQGAEIYLNGDRRGTTSTTLDEIPAEMEQVLELRLKGYQTMRQSVTLDPGETKNINFGTLLAESGDLRLRLLGLDSNMATLATVDLDGVVLNGTGDTRTAEGLALGVRQIKVIHPDYQPWNGTANIRDGQTTEMSAKLEPKPALLTLEIGPTGVDELTLSGLGEARTVRSGQTLEVPAGQVLNLRLTAMGFEDVSQRFELPASGSGIWQTTLAKIKPEPAAAPVFALTVSPGEAEARFWLADHTNMAIPGGRIELADLPPGEHELMVQAPGYQAFSTVVNVGLDRSGSADVRLVPLKGELRVQADPGTLVTAIDAQGKEIQLGTTDAKGVLAVANLLNIGTYDLRLSKALHRDELQRGVTLRIGKATDFKADLVPLPGKLSIFSVPQGAEIYVNGERKGTTSTTLDGIPAELEQAVELRLKGYRTVRQSVTLAPNSTKNVNFGTLLAESGDLRLRLEGLDAAAVAQAIVELDGVAISGTGATRSAEGLELGARQVKVTHPDYQPWSGTASIRDGQTTDLTAKLEPKPGRLTLEIGPNGVGELTLTGLGEARTVRNGQTLEVPTGKALSLGLTAKGFEEASQRFELPANGSATWRATLAEIKGPREGSDFSLDLGGGQSLEFVWVAALKGWAGKYEVTNGQYRRFKSAHVSGRYKRDSFNEDRQPVVDVRYDSAVAFGEWVTRSYASQLGGMTVRLPDGNEWIIIAQSGDGNKYPWGFGWPPSYGNYADRSDNSTSYLNYIDGYNDGFHVTCPVERSGKNGYGLYGVGGNVWEWTRDLSRSSHVMRGASWFDHSEFLLRCEARIDDSNSQSGITYGFRLFLFR